ncbi:hypothetical protein C1I97_38535, partial [Streptomyces sp. NTH33]
ALRHARSALRDSRAEDGVAEEAPTAPPENTADDSTSTPHPPKHPGDAATAGEPPSGSRGEPRHPAGARPADVAREALRAALARREARTEQPRTEQPRTDLATPASAAGTDAVTPASTAGPQAPAPSAGGTAGAVTSAAGAARRAVRQAATGFPDRGGAPVRGAGADARDVREPAAGAFRAPGAA